MYKTQKKLGFSVSLLVFLFAFYFFIPSANAQTISTNQNTQNTARSFGTTGNPVLEFTIVPQVSGAPTYIQTEINRSDNLTPDRNIWVNITDNSGVILATSSVISGLTLDVVPSLPHTYGGNAIFTFSGAPTLNTGTTYKIQYRLSSLENTYPYGSAGSTTGGTGQGTCCGGPYYMRYILSATAVPEIEWTDPTPQATVGNTLNFGSFNWNGFPTSSYTFADIFYTFSTSSDFSNPIISRSGTGPIASADWGVSGSGSGVWGYSDFIANISEITKIYTKIQLRGINVASSTILATDDTYIYFLPPTEYQTASSSLSNVFPFAYFYDIRDILTSLTATTTASFPTLQLNFGALMGTSTVFSSSTVSELLGNSNIQLFRTLMSYALWVMFAYAIYHEVKHLFRK